MMDIDELFEKPCWVIDFLPYQVKKDSEGRYFTIEEYFLENGNLKEKFLDIILKLNCYFDIVIDDVVNPDIASFIDKDDLNVLISSRDCLLRISKDFTHISVFNPDEEILKLLEQLARGAGLFLWRPNE
ncbi:MAG: hypothetical protein J6Z03_07240 [Erysipelotrichaceae bacterium]|nr:hypothetical protein [Erysipelotrichaceae bacterium]